MCLIALAVDAHPRFSLALAANRDEYYHRPAHPAQWWQSPLGQKILSGRDAQAGGTWLGLSKSGRLSALTNVRQTPTPQNSAALQGSPMPSRGQLVVQALHQDSIHRDKTAFAGFNLIHGDMIAPTKPRLFFESSTHQPSALDRGIHVVSNASLNTPWPKSQALRQRMDWALSTTQDHHQLQQYLLETLTSDQAAADENLPYTGIGLDRERQLSSPFIRMPGYGTRVSTFIFVERAKTQGLPIKVYFSEISWDSTTPNAKALSERCFEFFIRQGD